jgi:hypothetical protein
MSRVVLEIYNYFNSLDHERERKTTKNLDRDGSWHGNPVECNLLASIPNACPYRRSYLILKRALVLTGSFLVYSSGWTTNSLTITKYMKIQCLKYTV